MEAKPLKLKSEMYNVWFELEFIYATGTPFCRIRPYGSRPLAATRYALE